jgi:hypothetical protein
VWGRTIMMMLKPSCGGGNSPASSLLLLVLLAQNTNISSSSSSAAAAATGDICSSATAHLGCSGGHDLVPLKTAPRMHAASDCCALCKKTPNCTAWTWNGPGGNLMCYPKTACTHTTRGGCCETSGSAQPMPAPDQPPPPPPVTPVPPPPTPAYPFKDHTLPWAERVANLVSLMNTSEKVDILQTHAPAIPRLAVRGYSFETECDSGACGGSGGSIFYGACGGPCSTDNVTAFPQSIGMGQTWNTTLERAKGNIIGVELRSIAAANRPNFNAVYGLSCFSPMINIIRDVRVLHASHLVSTCLSCV